MLPNNDAKWHYNCVLYFFSCQAELDSACATNPEFSENIALTMPANGGLAVLTWGWWNFERVIGLPEAKPKKTCVFGVAAQLRRIARKKVRKKQAQLVGAD